MKTAGLKPSKESGQTHFLSSEEGKVPQSWLAQQGQMLPFAFNQSILWQLGMTHEAAGKQWLAP